MACTHNYNIFPRVIICQSEKISVDTNCSSPSYAWTPGGYTTQEVNLQAETEHSVTVSCAGCGADQTEEYCIPIIMPRCSNQNPPYESFSFSFTCDSGNSETVTHAAFEEQYICTADPIDWSTVEFDYTYVPTGIAAAYGGSADEISVTITYTSILPGVYYLPTRVKSTSGKYSNWATLRISIIIGNCCD